MIEEHFRVERLHVSFDRASNRVKFGSQRCFERCEKRVDNDDFFVLALRQELGQVFFSVSDVTHGSKSEEHDAYKDVDQVFRDSQEDFVPE